MIIYESGYAVPEFNPGRDTDTRKPFIRSREVTMTDTSNRVTERYRFQDIIIGILVFGSVWGVLEATLGGFFNLILFPNKGAIMAGIGVAIMGAALAIYRKPAMALAIGIVAASFKLLNVWIFVPVSYIHIVNPAMAIVLESLSFTAVAVFLKNRLSQNITVSIGAGVLAGILTAAVYFSFSLYVMQAPILERMGVSNIGEYLASNGIVQAVFYGVFLPVGYQLGQRLSWVKLPALNRPVYYGASAAIVCFCWGIAAIVTASGL